MHIKQACRRTLQRMQTRMVVAVNVTGRDLESYDFDEKDEFGMRLSRRDERKAHALRFEPFLVRGGTIVTLLELRPAVTDSNTDSSEHSLAAWLLRYVKESIIRTYIVLGLKLLPRAVQASLSWKLGYLLSSLGT